MGYWGYYVVGRGALGRCEALSGVRDELAFLDERRDGWQVWECPGGTGQAREIGSMNQLAQETGAPALFGYVMDSDSAVIEAASPEGGAWSVCLAPEATAAHLGQDVRALEDYFLPPAQAAERAVDWAAEAGAQVQREAVEEVLRAAARPSAEQLFFRFLAALGIAER